MAVETVSNVGTSNRKKLRASWFPALGILCLAGVLVWGVNRKYEDDLGAARRAFVKTSHLQAATVAEDVQDRFRQLYQGLRTIGRLPG